MWVAALFIFFSTAIAGSAIGAAWGDAGLGFYLFGSDIVAPNGLVYDPLMRLQMNLNVGSKKSTALHTTLSSWRSPRRG